MNLRLRHFGLAVISLAVLSSAAHAQASPSPYTTGYRYDAMGRVTGIISPDPDGAGILKFPAVRNTYDAAGFLIKVETGELSAWKSELPADAPVNWGTAFTPLTIVETTYDALGRKTRELVRGSNNAAVSITEYSYDSVGRLECTAQRMNTAVWGTPLANKCVPGTAGSYGPDRITRNVYDAAGQLLQVRKGVGSTVEAAEVTYTYTNNGKIKFVIDANGNKAELRYDGHDRQVRWVFPSTTKPTSFNDSTPANAVATAGALNESDYELYGYDANGNRTSLRKRDGSTLTYTYDNLNRMTVKVVPGSTTHTRDVYYGYDLRGLQTYARFDSTSGQGVTNVWDGFGRLTSTTVNLDGQSRQLSHLYDKDGNRTRITHPDAAYFTYTYDGLDRLNAVSNSAATVLVTPTYNNRGLLASAARYSSAHDQTFTHDLASRLSGLGISGGQTASAVSWTFTRNPASQLFTEARTNDAYAWTGHVNVNRSYTANGLNQYTAAGSASFCYDANGNLTADGTSVYKYDVENRLIEKRVQTNSTCSSLSYSGTLQATLRYDPLGRLHELGGSGGTIVARFLHDGDALVGEYNTSGTLLRRHVHGADAGADDPLIWFEGTGTAYTNARHLYADPRGSIVLAGNSSGASVATNTYDEYGIPGAANQGRFQYTGQAWLPELGMYYYKARIYSPTLGRFLQTDPIGYEDQVNLYAYVGNDPVNGVDPSGLQVAAVTRRAATSACAAQPEACIVGATAAAATGAAIVAAGARFDMTVNGHINSAASIAVPASHVKARTNFTTRTVSQSDSRRGDNYVIRVQIQGSEVGGNTSNVLAARTPISGNEVKGEIVRLMGGLTARQQRVALPAVVGAFSAIDKQIAAGGADPGRNLQGLNADYRGIEVRVDVEILKGRNLPY